MFILAWTIGDASSLFCRIELLYMHPYKEYGFQNGLHDVSLIGSPFAGGSSENVLW